ncbi:winged helix DNA-binding protein [Amorphus orientalis]|uniref:MarR family transcription regulator n=1 Tax=Amorphus orientalis TaxID=649198 RepID=A0AAE4ARS9_9HYPH|nr:winged helix DNA-binding protein [Amorphus orientalis]MDQ0315446.1 putative MarR family transcription regulator [Amorphus orientalis]
MAGSKSAKSESKQVANAPEGADYEAKLAEFEYAIWHLGAAFARWRRDCLASVSDISLSSTEASILHAVHMNGTAKGLMEIGRLLHRDDMTNIQYGLKKLGQLGLIEKQGRSRKSMTYAVSEHGDEIIQAYLDQRRAVLLRLFQQVAPAPDDLTNLIMQMHVMIGIYDQSGDLIMNRQP